MPAKKLAKLHAVHRNNTNLDVSMAASSVVALGNRMQQLEGNPPLKFLLQPCFHVCKGVSLCVFVLFHK
jgi:ABC-type hemin transport system ATPase subunit